MAQSHLYRLKFSDSETRKPDVEFQASDAYKALVMAHDRARYSPAELWRDGRKLCTIRRVEGEVWEIGPSTMLSEEALP